MKSSFDSFVTYRHRIVKQLPTNKTCKSGPGHPPAGGWHDCQAPPVEVGSLSQYLPGFFKHPRWCRMSGNQQYIILQEPAKSFFTTAIACLWDSRETTSSDYILITIGRFRVRCWLDDFISFQTTWVPSSDHVLNTRTTETKIPNTTAHHLKKKNSRIITLQGINISPW